MRSATSKIAHTSSQAQHAFCPSQYRPHSKLAGASLQKQAVSTCLGAPKRGSASSMCCIRSIQAPEPQMWHIRTTQLRYRWQVPARRLSIAHTTGVLNWLLPGLSACHTTQHAPLPPAARCRASLLQYTAAAALGRHMREKSWRQLFCALLLLRSTADDTASAATQSEVCSQL
jgi:hypothetical protein